MTMTRAGMPYVDADPGVAALIEAEMELQPIRRRYRRSTLQIHLTDELVRAAQPGAQEVWTRDAEDPHLALRVRPTGAKSFYFLRLDRNECESRRKYLGSASDYTVAEARKKAEWARGKFGLLKPPPKLRGDMRIKNAFDEYFKDHPPQSSDWFKMGKGLVAKLVVPRFGNRTLSGVRKDQWLLLIETTALEQQSRGANLLKVLRAFLSWAVRRGLLEANPLAGIAFDLPPVRKPSYLGVEDLVMIYDAAQELGRPWAAMVGLVILTGEAMEDVRHIRDRDIDWRTATWKLDWTDDYDFMSIPTRTVHLSPEALTLLTPYRDVKGYFFQSPRAFFPKPISFYTEINDRLKAKSGLEGEWGAREIRRVAYREIERLGRGTDALSAWSKRFASELVIYRRKRDGLDDVVL